MKKLTKLLRFLSLLFFLFLAVIVCFVFNKLLDQRINASQTNALEALHEYQQETNDAE